MNETFVVLTDSFHKSGFKHQSEILYSLIMVVEMNIISEHLFSNTETNKNFVLRYLIDLNSTAFTHINRIQIESFALGLFNKIYSFPDFKSTIRDFLVNLKSFSGNHEELFEEERKQQLEEAKLIEEKKRLNIPGLLPVYNINDYKKLDTENYKKIDSDIMLN